MGVRQNPLGPSFWVTPPVGVRGDWAAGYHTGDDYSTRGLTGYPVYSTWPGWAWATGTPWGSAYGLQVIVTGPLRLIRMGYCHLNSVSVQRGQLVQRGTLLGHSGDTGRSTGPHLHYEERRSPFGYGDCRRPRRNDKGSHHGEEGTQRR